MGKITIGRDDSVTVQTVESANPIIQEPSISEPTIIEVPVEVIKEVPVEVIKYVDREVVVEKLVEVIKQVEVPVEVIKEVEKEIIKEVPIHVETKVIDLSQTFELQTKLNDSMRTNKKLQVAISILVLALVVALMR